jgi:hypothetical protein
MARLAWRKPLKINSVERYALDLNSSSVAQPDRAVGINFLNGDAITDFDIAATDGSGIVIAGKANASGVLSCLISGGLDVGNFDIEFTFSTSERSDCQKVRLKLAEACESSIPATPAFISTDGYLISDGYLLDDAYLIEGV